MENHFCVSWLFKNMRCCCLEVGKHQVFQQGRSFCLLLARIHCQTSPFPRQRARSLLDICPIIPPLTGNLAGLTHLLAPRAPAVGQSLQKNKKNRNNSNRLNYLSCTGDRSWAVASFNSLWSRNTELHHPEVKWGLVMTRFTPAAPGEAQGTHKSRVELPAPFKGVRHEAHGTSRPPGSCWLGLTLGSCLPSLWLESSVPEVGWA